MALSTAVLIADTIKSACLSRSLVDASAEKSLEKSLVQPRVLIRILLCQSEQTCTWLVCEWSGACGGASIEISMGG